MIGCWIHVRPISYNRWKIERNSISSMGNQLKLNFINWRSTSDWLMKSRFSTAAKCFDENARASTWKLRCTFRVSVFRKNKNVSRRTPNISIWLRTFLLFLYIYHRCWELWGKAVNYGQIQISLNFANIGSMIKLKTLIMCDEYSQTLLFPCCSERLAFW